VPFGSFESTSRRPTANPAPCSCEAACWYGRPITGGTATGARPFETLILTVVPSITFVPAFGACAVTVPAGCDEWISTTFGWSCRAASAAAASVDECPTTFGTIHFRLPVETVIVTVLPLSSFSPADGCWSITCVAATVALDV